MPRELKPHTVDTIEHKLGAVPIYLDRNKAHKGEFWAEFAGHRTIYYKTLDEAKSAIVELMQGLGDLTWVPVIGIVTGRPSSNYRPHSSHRDYKAGASVGVKAERFWYAVRRDGVQYRSDWSNAGVLVGRVFDDDEPQVEDVRLERSKEWKPISVRRSSGTGYSSKTWYEYPPLDLPTYIKAESYSYDSSDGTLYIAHSDEAWAMLTALAAHIEQLADKLKAFLDNERGVRALVGNLSGLPLLASPEHEAIAEVPSDA